MSAVYPTLPKLSVKDGFDDEDLTDIDDEVFIRDGKGDSLKLDDDRGVKRPLMAPRRKYKKSRNFEAYRFSNRAVCVPLCFGLMALLILLSLIVLCIYIVNIIPMPIAILRNWLSRGVQESPHESNIVPCTSLTTTILWTRSLPKLRSETPLRSNDVNGDGVEDIVVGFNTGLDITTTPEYVCASYFDGQNPCFGGILALNGRTGDTLWMHWTAHAISSIDCGLDLNNDRIKDCIICGRSGILHAVNGDSGASLWELPVRDLEEWEFSDIYDAKFIADIDGDDIGDVIASHSMQSREIRSNEILLISGINGHIIHSSVLPNSEQLFSAPQKLVHPDGESMFVLATSSQKRSGGLYIVPQVNLMYGELKLRKLHHNTGRGTLLPPILVDVTLDGVEDIVAAMFNSTIIVYDGLTFKPIWNYTVPNSEVISVPIPGYYNDDDVPDFMVKHQMGSGFPTYYYTVATIIDGKTGRPLLEKSMEDSLSEEMSGLSVTVDGFGNDWFLHWSIDCLNYEGIKEKYQFLKGGDFLFDSRADLCKLRFNSTLITNLYALSQHVGPPGISLYFSEDWKSLEYNNSKAEYDAPFVSERSTKIYKDRSQIDALKQKQRDSYENYNQFVDNNRNDNFDEDYGLKDEDKWARKKIDKNDLSYEVPYNEDDKANVQEAQPLDYQQVDEIREERSDVNRGFINQPNNRVNVVFNKDHSNTGNNKLLNEGAINRIPTNVTGNLQPESFNRQNDQMDVNREMNETELNKRKKREIKMKGERVYSARGVQKQPPTGILLPSIFKPKGRNSVDLVFSTFWLPTSEVPVVLVQQDLECIHWKKVLSEKNQQYKQSDEIIKECLGERGVDYKTRKETLEKENVRVSLGQTTVYRMRLECTCPEDMPPNQTCRNISSHQSWPEYLGSHGNGYFRPLYKTNI